MISIEFQELTGLRLRDSEPGSQAVQQDSGATIVKGSRIDLVWNEEPQEYDIVVEP